MDLDVSWHHSSWQSPTECLGPTRSNLRAFKFQKHFPAKGGIPPDPTISCYVHKWAHYLVPQSDATATIFDFRMA